MSNWRRVIGYENLYEVSDQGEIRSLDRTFWHSITGEFVRRGKPVRQRVEDCRNRVRLTKNGVVRNVSVHRIVLEAFVGPCPPGMEGCHNDGNPRNNVLTNLRWDTRSENQRDSIRHGTHSMARKTHCKRNHAFTAENTYVFPNGARQCKTCRRERDRGEHSNSRKSRFTAVMLAALPLALIPVGLLTSAPADAGPIHDYAYIVTLDEYGIHYSSEPAAIAAGLAVCDQLDRAISLTTVMRGFIKAGYSRDDAEIIVGAAMGAYCPRHLANTGRGGAIGGAVLR